MSHAVDQMNDDRQHDERQTPENEWLEEGHLVQGGTGLRPVDSGVPPESVFGVK